VWREGCRWALAASEAIVQLLEGAHAIMAVVFVDPVCPTPYSLETLRTQPMGGTEATLVRIAERLDATVAQRGRTHADGRYVPYASVTSATHLVVLRDPAALVEWHAKLPQARTYLWLHDLLPIGSPQAQALRQHAAALASMNATVVAVSEFHRDQVLAVLRRVGASLRVRRIYNPIADDLQLCAGAIDPFKLIFASQPKQGLEVTLLALAHVHRLDPRYRLCVANPGYRQLTRRSQPGVEWLGELPHARVLGEIATALCVFYPNFHYPETFGLVCTESNALGTPVLAHPIGAVEVLANTQPLLPIDDKLMAAHRLSRHCRVDRCGARRSAPAARWVRSRAMPIRSSGGRVASAPLYRAAMSSG
jgi:hypothetical protein